MHSIEIPADLRDRLIAIARAGLPNEVCGYVAGSRNTTLQASAVYPVKNAGASPTRFALDGQSMIDAERQIDADGLEIVAIFHSHPAGPPTPSALDQEDAAIYDPRSHFAHVLISLQGFVPQIRVWRYGQGDPVELAITGSEAT